MTGHKREEGSLTSQEMTLEVLGVEVSLLAVRARELAILILLGNNSSFGAACSDGHRLGPTWCTWQDASPSLRPDDMCGLILLLERRLLHRHVGRRYAGLGTEPGGHWAQGRGGRSV